MAGNLQQIQKSLCQFSSWSAIMITQNLVLQNIAFILLKLWGQTFTMSLTKAKSRVRRTGHFTRENLFLVSPSFWLTWHSWLVTTLVQSLFCGRIKALLLFQNSNLFLLPSYKHTCGSCVHELQPESLPHSDTEQTGNMNCFWLDQPDNLLI